MKGQYYRTYEQRAVPHVKLDRVLLRRLMGYLQPYRYYFAGALVLLLLSKGLEAYIPICIGRVVNHILADPFPEESFSAILRQGAGIAALVAASYAFETFNVVLKHWIGQKGLLQLRRDVYAHIQSMPLRFFNQTPVGTLMTRTIHDVEQINQLFSESIVPLIGSILLFVSICIGLLIVDWRAAFVVFAIIPPLFGLTQYFRINQRRCYDRVRAILAALNTFVQEDLLGASTIRSFGLEAQERKVFEEINADHRTANVDTIHYFSLFFAGIDFFQALALILVFGVLAAVSRFNAGAYFTFSLYILMLFRPLVDLAERYNLLQSAAAAADRIFHVLDQPKEMSPDPVQTLEMIEEIEFRDVWFAYKEAHWILKGISFRVRQGEAVALVGMTGSGKTTVMNLLLRFYDHQKGEILINGCDIRNYALADVRRQFSVVLQDPEIFFGSIRDNITLGDPEIDAEAVAEALEFVNLGSVVRNLPGGFDHVLMERGKGLSAGERQLISLARALAHRRSGLILDEATANIDVSTEKVIQTVLKKVLHNKTSIVIAHRLSTIRDVGRILVFHEGRVAEAGSHDELLQKRGIYEKLYRLHVLS